MSESQEMGGVYRGYHQWNAFRDIKARIETAFLTCLLVHIKTVDDNWSSLTILFHRLTQAMRRELADRHRIEIDYRPQRVVLNGPRNGDVDITGMLGEVFICDELVGLLAACVALLDTDWLGVKIHNIHHRIEIIPDRTMIVYHADHERGVVRRLVSPSSENPAFMVERCSPGGKLSQQRYTLSQLERELGEAGVAAAVEYGPFLTRLLTPSEQHRLDGSRGG